MAAIRGFSLAGISKIRVVFSTFDVRVGPAREFFRRVSASKMKESNLKCQVTSTISGDYSDPTVDITFNDGSTMHFDTAGVKVLDMVAQINSKARTLQ